jgi:hypothetical protein
MSAHEEGKTMKYMLLMQGPLGEYKKNAGVWSPDVLKEHMRFMHELNEELVTSGELVDGQGLAAPDTAKIVQAQTDGSVAVTDGPFAEAKEFLAGYWILDCESEERAMAVAARASAAPGPGGGPVCMPIEVRQVMSVTGVEM